MNANTLRIITNLADKSSNYNLNIEKLNDISQNLIQQYKKYKTIYKSPLKRHSESLDLALAFLILTDKFKRDNNFYYECLNIVNGELDEETDSFIKTYSHIGIKQPNSESTRIKYTDKFETNLINQKVFVAKHLKSFKNFVSDEIIEQYFYLHKSLMDYVGINPQFLPKSINDKLGNLLIDKDNKHIPGITHSERRFGEICPDTFNPYDQIFKYVLNNEDYMPFAMLKNKGEFVGIIKFKEYFYSLGLDNLITEDDSYISFKGMVTQASLQNDFKLNVKSNTKKGILSIVNIDSDMELTPITQLTENQPYYTGYFTKENINTKINLFMNEINKKVKENKIQVFNYNS